MISRGFRTNLRLGVLAAIGALLHGCDLSPEVAAPQPSVGPELSAPELEPVPTPQLGGPRVQRLVAQRVQALQATPARLIQLPVDQEWTYVDDTDVEFLPQGAARIATDTAPTRMTRAISLDAEQYRGLRVKASATSGGRITVHWRGDFVPSFAKGASLTAPIVASEESRIYTFTLNPLRAPDWCGRVTEISLTFSEQPGNVTIESIELVPAVGAGPRRVTFQNETREGVLGSQEPWKVYVPPEADFETWIGVRLPESHQVRSSLSRFRVTVTPENGSEEVVAEAAVHSGLAHGAPSWQRLRTDLRRFEGQEVELALTVERDLQSAAQPYWGSPVVFSRTREDFVPVILISMDTTRADRLSVYGYERDTTPTLRRFANDAVVFENAQSEEPWTLPAHHTMMTGMHPRSHGVTPSANLREAKRTLAELLGEAGYVTGGFTGADGWLASWRGLGHGFDRYSTPRDNVIIRPAAQSFELATQWLSSRLGSNPFVFLHSMDVHALPTSDRPPHPYGPPAESQRHFSRHPDAPATLGPKTRGLYGSTLLSKVNQGELPLSTEEHAFYGALYDDAIRYVDTTMGTFFAKIHSWGLYNPALIIVTADHGEELFERGRYGHATVHRENSRVPLLIKFPGNEFARTRYSGLVQLADILPTVADVVGFDAGTIDGVSLRQRLQGAPAADEVYQQRYAHEAVVSAEWKYIRNSRNGRQVLYDLTIDPLERENVVVEQAESGAELEALRENYFDDMRPGWHIVVDNSRKKSTSTLRLECEKGFRDVRRKRRDRNNNRFLFPKDEFVFSARLECAPGELDSIYLNPVDATSALDFAFEPSQDTHVAVGLQDFDRFTGRALRISPGDAEGVCPTLTPPDEGFQITVRFVPEQGEDDPRPMTETDRATLEALGYL